MANKGRPKKKIVEKETIEMIEPVDIYIEKNLNVDLNIDLKDEIENLKILISGAMNEGANSLAIAGNFDKLFFRVSELEIEVQKLTQDIFNIKNR